MKQLVVLVLFVSSVFGQGNVVEELSSLGLTETARYVSYTSLQELLASEGPVTFFAPTNDAWANLDPFILAILEVDYELLEEYLNQHLIFGEEVKAADLSNELTKNAYNELPIRFNIYANGAVTATGSKISTVDQQASNGVIHMVDDVIDIQDGTIMDEVRLDIDLTILANALELTGLDSVFDGTEPYTIFAPFDEEFLDLPDGVLEDLLLDPEALEAVLKYHVLPGTVFIAGMTTGNYTTLNGQDIFIDVLESGEGIDINGVPMDWADTPAFNGVIHYIRGVLLPQAEK